MNLLLHFIAIISIFAFSVFFHEVGHYFFIRKAGLQPTSFSIGSGPALLRFHFQGTLFVFHIIPFNGHVKFPSDSPIRFRKFFFIAMGGIIFNFLLLIPSIFVHFLIGFDDVTIPLVYANSFFIFISLFPIYKDNDLNLFLSILKN